MNILEKVNSQALFIVCGTPDQGLRSKVLDGKLGIDILFIQTNLPRGALYAWIKYPIQALKTIWLLLHKKPWIIFVQEPPPHWRSPVSGFSVHSEKRDTLLMLIVVPFLIKGGFLYHNGTQRPRGCGKGVQSA